mgnify:CR=1 FL=1
MSSAETYANVARVTQPSSIIQVVPNSETAPGATASSSSASLDDSARESYPSPSPARSSPLAPTFMSVAFSASRACTSACSEVVASAARVAAAIAAAASSFHAGGGGGH